MTNEAFKIPHDLVNEQIMLAAAIVDPQARAAMVRRVRADLFREEAHAIAWALVQRAHAQGIEPAPDTLVQLSAGKLDLQYLADLVRVHPAAPPSLSHHIEALFWDAARANAVSGPLAELLKGLQDPATAPERVRALAKQVPLAFEGLGKRQFLRDSTKLLKEHGQTLRARMAGLACYPYGIEGLDLYGPEDEDEEGNSLDGQPLIIPGAAPGKVTTITAISGGGKSTIAALIALMQARRKRSVLFGAWEMGAEETLELMVAISAGIPRSRVRTGQITPAELELLEQRMEAISQWVRFVDQPFGKDAARHSTDEILDQIHGYIADSGAEVAIFDLWRRAFRKLNDESEEAEALYRQQAIAEETQAHVVLVQQQRLKDVEQRTNPIPTREGIKGSSAWVDVSDTILGIYLPSLLKQEAANVIQLLILKQRFGRWPVKLEFDWHGDLVRLTNGRIVSYYLGSEQTLGPSPSARKFTGRGRH